VNCYRSGVSTYLPEIESYKIGQHPIIKQIMHGVGAYNGNPPKPRYPDTWYEETALVYIKGLAKNDM